MMAESQISILNLSTHDRDFVLVGESDLQPAILLIRERYAGRARLPSPASAHLRSAAARPLPQRRPTPSGPLHRLGGDVDALKEAITELHELQLKRTRSISSVPPGHEAGEPAPEDAGGDACAAAALCSEATASGPRLGSGGSRSGSSGAGTSGGADATDSSANGVAAAAEGMAVRDPLLAIRSSRRIDEAGAGEGGGDLFIRVLAPSLVVIRLQMQMLEPSTHALMKRLLFSPRRATSSFWAYTQTEDDISLIIDEAALTDFPPGAVLGSPAPWRAMKLCGRSFAFDETGVVSAMFAPYRSAL